MPKKNTRLSNSLQITSSLYVHLCCISTPASSVALLTLGLVGSRNDRRRLGDVLAEDVTLDEVGKPDRQLVADELASRDGEDLCGK